MLAFDLVAQIGPDTLVENVELRVEANLGGVAGLTRVFGLELPGSSDFIASIGQFVREIALYWLAY